MLKSKKVVLKKMNQRKMVKELKQIMKMHKIFQKN